MQLDPAVGRVPPSGWYLEVDIETDGGTQTLTPAVLGEPEWTPSVNRLPEAEIPVPTRAAWIEGQGDGAGCRVWRDGARLPIEEVVAAQRREGDGRDETILRCQGGLQLKRRAQKVVQNDPAATVVENLITSETDLVANVDDIAGAGEGESDETTLLSVTSSTEFANNLSPVAGEDFSDSAVALELLSADDVIERQQTSWLWTAADDANADQHLDAAADAQRVTGVDAAADDQVIRLAETNSDEMVTRSQVTVGHDIPQMDFRIAVRARETAGNTSDRLRVTLTGDETGVGEIDLEHIPGSFEWRVFGPVGGDWDFVNETLNAGEAVGLVLDINTLGSPAGWEVDVDAVAVYDARLDHQFDAAPDPHLEQPSPYGGRADIARLESAEQLSQSTLEGARTELTATTSGIGAGTITDNLEAMAATPEGSTTTVGTGQATVEPGALSDRAWAGAGGGTGSAGGRLFQRQGCHGPDQRGPGRVQGDHQSALERPAGGQSAPAQDGCGQSGAARAARGGRGGRVHRRRGRGRGLHRQRRDVAQRTRPAGHGRGRGRLERGARGYRPPRREGPRAGERPDLRRGPGGGAARRASGVRAPA